MPSIIDLENDISAIFSEISNILMYFKYFTLQEKFKIFNDIDLNEIINLIFWIFLAYSFCFIGFYKFFYVFLRSSKIKYYKRKQFARSIWNISFFAASSMFLYHYHEYMISPQIIKNTEKLFPTYDSQHTIFYLGHECDRFKLYSLIIITFYLHAAMLDFKENDFCEAVTKILYSFAITALTGYRFENYFVILNLNQGIFNIITECLFLLALQTSGSNRLIHQLFLGLRIASWSHVFISLLPFKYLVPTLFAKNFKFFLNFFIWLWYGLSIWNSPVLQYFYHQTYHNTLTDCAGEGSAAKCILLKDSTEHRHFKLLRKAYLEVKLANEKVMAVNTVGPATEGTSSARTYQAIKCIMTLKRKLRRIREGRDAESTSPNTSTSIDLQE